MRRLRLFFLVLGVVYSQVKHGVQSTGDCNGKLLIVCFIYIASEFEAVFHMHATLAAKIFNSVTTIKFLSLIPRLYTNGIIWHPFHQSY